MTESAEPSRKPRKKKPPTPGYPRGDFPPSRIAGLTNHGPGKEPNHRHGAGDMRHLARPTRRVEILAAQISGKYLDGYCPEQLRMPQFMPAVEAWARAEARARLMSDWLDTMTVEQMAEPPDRAGAVKVPFELWLSAENAAAKRRKDLGLDPASYAGIMKDLGIAGRRQDDAIGRMGQAGAQIRQQRQATVTVLRPEDEP